MTNASEAAQTFAKTQVISKESVQAFATSQKAAVASTSAFSGAIRGLGAAFKSLGFAFLNMAIITGISMAVEWVIGKISDQINRVEILKEKIVELNDDYQTSQDEIKSLNSELDATNDKISELLKKGPLTFVEEGELEKLREVGETLQLAIAIAKNEAETAARELAEAQVKLFNEAYKPMGDVNSFKSLVDRWSENRDDYMPAGEEFTYNKEVIASSATMGIARSLADVRILQDELKTVQDSARIDSIETEIKNINAELFQELKTLEGIRDALSAMPSDSLTDSQKQVLSDANAAIDYLYSEIDPFNYQTDVFNKVFNDKQFSNVRESLIKLAEQGKLTASTFALDPYSGFVKALNDVGLTANDATTQLLALYAATEETPSVAIESYETLAEAYNNYIDAKDKSSEILASGTPVSPDQYKELIDANAAYADAFKQSGDMILLNADAVRELEEAEQQELLSRIKLAKSQQSKEYGNLYDQIASYKSALASTEAEYQKVAENQSPAIQEVKDSLLAQIAALESQISVSQESQAEIQSSINDLDRLSSAIIYNTSAYQRWIDAQDTSSTGMYDDMRNALEALKDGLEAGTTYTEKYRAALELLVPEDKRGDVAAYVKFLESYLTEGADGVEKFYKRLVKRGLLKELKDGTVKWTSKFTSAEVATSMGFSVDDASAMLLVMEQYGVQLDTIEAQQTSLNKTSETTSEAYAKLTEQYTSFQEAQSKARAMLESDEPISQTDYDELIALNEKYAGVIDSSTGSMRINADALRQLEFEQQREIALDVATAKSEAIKQYAENAKQIAINEKALERLTKGNEEYREGQEDAIWLLEDEIEAYKDTQSALAQQISGYDTLTSSIRYATSAYKRWLDSQNAPEAGDMYRSMTGALDDLKEGLETGAMYTEKFKAVLELLVPDDQRDNVQAYIKTLERYIGEGTDGLENFYNDLIKNGFLQKLEDGSVQWAKKFSLSEIAESFNLSDDFVQSLLLGLQEHGLNTEFITDYSEATTAVNDLATATATLEEAQKKLDEVLANPASTDKQKKASEDNLAAAQEAKDAAQSLLDGLSEPELTLADKLTAQIAEVQAILDGSNPLQLPAVLQVNLDTNLPKIQAQLDAIEEARQLAATCLVSGDYTTLVKELEGLKEPSKDDPDYGIKYPVYLFKTQLYKDTFDQIFADRKKLAAGTSMPVSATDETGDVVDGAQAHASEDQEFDLGIGENTAEAEVVTVHDEASADQHFDLSIGENTATPEITATQEAASEDQDFAVGADTEPATLAVNTLVDDISSRTATVKVKIETDSEPNNEWDVDVSKDESIFDSEKWYKFRAAVASEDTTDSIRYLSELLDEFYGKSIGDLGINTEMLPSIQSVSDMLKDLEEKRIAGVSQAADDLSEKSVGDLGLSEVVSVADQAKDKLDELNRFKLDDKTLTINQNIIGTSGTAYAKGSTNVKEGTALVAEVPNSKETVLRNDNTYEVYDKPTFVHMEGGESVLNDKQTRNAGFNKSGKVGQRFSIATGIKSAIDWVKNVTSAAILSVTGGKSPAPVFNNKSSSSSSKSSSSGSSSSSSFDKLWDWIEIRLDKLKEITEDFVRGASNAIGYLTKNLNLDKAVASVRDQLTASETAYKQYMAQADAVASKYKLSADIINKIQNGSLDITEYSDTVKEQIQTYQDWYEKAQDVKSSINDLNDQLKELGQQRLDNIITDFDNLIDRIDRSVSLAQAKIDLKLSTGREVTEGDYQSIIDNTANRIETLAQKRTALNAAFEALVIDGTIEKDSDMWYEYTGQIADLDAEILQTNIDMQDFKDTVSQITITNLQYALTALQKTQTAIENIMSLHDTQGTANTGADYKKLIDLGYEQINNLLDQNKALESQLIGLDKLSEKYQEIASQIQENEQAIWDVKNAQEQWNDASIDLQIEALQKQKDELQKTNDQYQRQLNLQQKIEDMETAKQRTAIVYREGVGYVREADQTKLQDAQNAFDEAMHEETLAKIDDAIDALEDLKTEQNVYDSEGNKLTKYADGGIVPVTGPAFVHAGETIFSKVDSQKLYDFIHNASNASYFLTDNLLKQINTSSSAFNGLVGARESLTSLEFSGDIKVYGVGDTDGLAKEIVASLPNKVLQKLHER